MATYQQIAETSDTYYYSQYQSFICRFCANKGSLLSSETHQRLIECCECKDVFKYTHVDCLSHFIETSCWPDAFEYCPVCLSAYKSYNRNFNTVRASQLYHFSIAFEIIKLIILILCTFFATTIAVLIFQYYVYDFSHFFGNYEVAVGTIILAISVVLCSLLGNLFFIIKGLRLRHQYYKRDKNCTYRKHNYDAYITFFKGKFCNKTWKLIVFVIIFILFFYISFIVAMIGLELYNKKNKLRNYYYSKMYVSND
jgi:hypothetical protein